MRLQYNPFADHIERQRSYGSIQEIGGFDRPEWLG
jgi:hypothetical protein